MKVRNKLLLAVLIFFTSCFSLYAQDDDWFWDHQIAEVEFEGLKNVKKSSLSGISSAYIDSYFTEDVYSQILDKLYALDYFDDIIPYVKHAKNPDKILLVFQVVERPVISKIDFKGNKGIRNGELREKINIKISDVYVESLVLFDERTLRDYYLSKGYSDIRISHQTVEKDGNIEVTFDITEGSSTVISKIAFQGISVVSERNLKSKLSLKEVGLFKDGAFQSSTLEQDKQTILAFYQEQGYIDASIEDTQIERVFNEDKSRDELSITFYITEGSQYIYKGCVFDGNEVFDTERLSSFVRLKEDDVFNNTKFQEAMSNITSLYLENGYMGLDFRPVVSKDSDRHEIKYYIFISENTRSHIENISVKGNFRTKDYVVLREIPIESGDVFSRESIMNGLRNLYNTQFFSNVVPEYSQGSEPNLVDLVFSVEEQSTNNVQFGLSFSGNTSNHGNTDFQIPFSLFGKFEFGNLFGEGKTLSTGLTVSTTEQSLDFTYGQSWIKNLPIQFSSSLAIGHKADSGLRWIMNKDGSFNQDNYYMPFTGYSLTFSNSLGRRWTPNFAIITVSGGISNSINNNLFDETVFLPVDIGLSQFANRWGFANSIWSSFSIDGRDISYDPTKGWFASERLSWTGFFPNLETEFYLTTDTKAEAYWTFLSIPFNENYTFKLTLAGYSGLTTVIPVGNFLSDSSKVYIDGVFNGRGWQELSVGKYRGNALWSNKIEIRSPIVQNIIGVAGFFDAAVIKDKPEDLFNQLKVDDFYFSYGVAARFLIPQFPIHLVWAWKFRSNAGTINFENEMRPIFVLSFNIVNK